MILTNLGTGPEGLEIGVVGFEDSPTNLPEHPAQVYIEVYEGKLRVYVWNGSGEDPVAEVELDPLP